MSDSLSRAADALEARGVMLGGPRANFGLAGRKQLMALLHHGMGTDAKVLDIGCGSLRAGHLLVRLLDPGCYFGIEPDREMLRAGIEVLLGEELVAAKRPTFSEHDDFSMTQFGETFDYYLARSIWSHASKPQIEAMLDGFVATSVRGATFLTSYYPATEERPDYDGAEWVGRSHESVEQGTIAHDLRWIARACQARGLRVEEARAAAINFGAQTWLRIRYAR
ncbi:class I SAM-dependent methyltransferase [Nocardioides caeni]|uniref:Class I SAM-dependent methyltransferase n=1 Tax=Nocardioides caeni TaxID=574700 RepID=A0A4S8NGC1_9ACTN|nr:class I SAM-dependent methyltransferase [Nocardioides caeni]THV15893.1 class I SAM-dependent methyltransferase [Nocardioides caeni]